MFTLVDFSGFAKAASVTPTMIEGPHDPEYEGYTAVKLEPNGDSFQDIQYELLEGAIKVTISDNGTKASFISTIPISKVYVKGGNSGEPGDKYFGYLFEYGTPVKIDTDLYALENQNGRPMGISHIVFYYKIIKYDISITKQIKEDGTVREWKAGDEEFSFTIKLKDSPESEVITKPTVSGVAHFNNLVAGVYEVTEATKAGYKVDYNGNDEITVGGEESNFVIINEKEKHEDPKYDISITKQIKEDGTVREWKAGDEEFSFTIKLKDSPESEVITKPTVSGVAHFDNLVAGVYEVTEATKAGYKVDYNGNDEITVGGEESNFVIINEKEIQVGMLKVVKDVEKCDGYTVIAREGQFTFKLYKPNDLENPVAIEETNEYGEAIFESVPVGKYILKEQYVPGYISSISNEGIEVEVFLENTTIQYVINKEVGNIKVVKKIQIGDGRPTTPGDKKFTFYLYKAKMVPRFAPMQHEFEEDPIKVGETNADGILEFKDLPVGIYKLVEKDESQYTSSIGDGIELEVQKGVTTEQEVINYKEQEEDPTGSIRIVKKVKMGETGTPGPVPEGVAFTFTIYKVNGDDLELIGTDSTGQEGILEITGLPLGKYIIKEADKEGYISGIGKDGVEVTVEKDKTTIKEVVNTKIIEVDPVGSIMIFKKVKIGDKEPAAPDKVKFTFNLLKDGKVFRTGETNVNGILVFEKLPVGEYVLEEAPTDDYTTSLNSSNNKIIVKKNETTTVEVVNTLKQTDEDSDEDEDLPNTGGFAEMELFLAAAGALIILLGIRLRRVRR